MSEHTDERDSVFASDVPEASSQNRDSRILLFLGHEENRRLLADWLSDSYDVATIERPESLDQEFDLCIVDERMFGQYTDAILQRKETDEVGFSPFLLMCPYPLSDLEPTVWQHVEEVISTPVQQGELKTRIDGLLDRRHQFTALRQHQKIFEALHDATREMIQATEPERICEIAVHAADRALNLPLTAAWLVDETGQQLNPVAQTDESGAVFDELPVYTAEANSLSWQAFENGETKVFDELRATVSPNELHNAETTIQSELIVPLGKFGVMNTGSSSPRQFDDNDVCGIQLLAANAGTALERAKREQQLAQQNSRMEFFHSILRHDVLNGMTVIQSRAEVLADQLEDDEHRQYALAIENWSNDIVDVVTRVRSVLQTLTGDSPITIEPINLFDVLRSEVASIETTYPTVTIETTVPESVDVLGDELLSEVFGNILTNAVEHNDPTELHITTTVEVDEEFATVRIADTGSGIPDDHKELIFRRGKTGHAKSTGSGFGLFFVDSMIEEYGGDIWVEDNDPHGAVFVVQLPIDQ